MNWQPIPSNAYALLSDCGHWSVCKVWSETGYLYQAWRTAKHPEGRALLAARLPDAETAKARCEGDK